MKKHTLVVERWNHSANKILYNMFKNLSLIFGGLLILLIATTIFHKCQSDRHIDDVSTALEFAEQKAHVNDSLLQVNNEQWDIEEAKLLDSIMTLNDELEARPQIIRWAYGKSYKDEYRIAQDSLEHYKAIADLYDTIVPKLQNELIATADALFAAECARDSAVQALWEYTPDDYVFKNDSVSFHLTYEADTTSLYDPEVGHMVETRQVTPVLTYEITVKPKFYIKELRKRKLFKRGIYEIGVISNNPGVLFEDNTAPVRFKKGTLVWNRK